MSLCHARWATRAANGVEDEDFSVPAGHIGEGEKKIFATAQSVTVSMEGALVPGSNSVHVMSSLAVF